MILLAEEARAKAEEQVRKEADQVSSSSEQVWSRRRFWQQSTAWRVLVKYLGNEAVLPEFAAALAASAGNRALDEFQRTFNVNMSEGSRPSSRGSLERP